MLCAVVAVLPRMPVGAAANTVRDAVRHAARLHQPDNSNPAQQQANANSDNYLMRNGRWQRIPRSRNNAPNNNHCSQPDSCSFFRESDCLSSGSAGRFLRSQCPKLCGLCDVIEVEGKSTNDEGNSKENNKSYTKTSTSTHQTSSTATNSVEPDDKQSENMNMLFVCTQSIHPPHLGTPFIADVRVCRFVMMPRTCLMMLQVDAGTQGYRRTRV